MSIAEVYGIFLVSNFSNWNLLTLTIVHLVIFLVIVGAFLWILGLKRKLVSKTETELFQAEDKFASKLLQLVQNPVVVIDTKGDIVRYNASFRRLIGKKEENILYNPFWTVMAAEQDRENLRLGFYSYLKDKTPYDLNETIISSNNDIRHLVWKYNRLNDENGQLQYFIFSGVDITDQLQRENELKASEEKFRKLFERILTGILFYEPILNEHGEFMDMRFIEVNPSFQMQTGLDPITIVGKTFKEVFGELDTKFADEYNLYQQTGHYINKERYLKVLKRYFRTQLFELMPGRMAVIFDDVTEVKMLEQKLIETIINAEERERKRIARDLHDEIGPQLASMNVYVSSLLRKNENPEQKEVILILRDLIKDSINKAREISNNLTPGVIEKYGLVSAIKADIETIRLILPVNFECSISSRFDPKVEISIYRIAKELLNNSKKYSQATQVDVILKCESDILSFWYSDNGIGFKLDSYMKNANKGMGLLNIESRCKAIKGIYKMWSRPSKGFTFHLTVPVNLHNLTYE